MAGSCPHRPAACDALGRARGRAAIRAVRGGLDRGLISAALAAAVDPGWTLVLLTFGLFAVVELIAGQLVEPQLYGHSTGLSPLSVVVAAIFWSWIWGPVGLVVSTPLTLCLVVMGRHVKALRLLDIMLGDSQALTMPERFYQRALSADSDELIANARAYLKHDSLAAYSDFVLMPALRLAAFDLERRTITREQQLKVRQTIVTVIAAISGGTTALHATAPRDVDARTNERRTAAPATARAADRPLAGTAGRAARLDHALPEHGFDVRRPGHGTPGSHFARQATRCAACVARGPQGAAAGGRAGQRVDGLRGELGLRATSGRRWAQPWSSSRARFAHAPLIGVCLPGLVLQQGGSDSILPGTDKSASSLVDALQICVDWLEERTKT